MVKKLMASLLTVLMVVSLIAPAWAADDTWSFPVPTLGGLNEGDVIIATSSSRLTNKTGANTDGTYMVPPSACNFATAPVAGQQNITGFVASRISSSVFAYARQAQATESYYIACPLNSWLQRVGTTRGIKINTLKIAYQILAIRNNGALASGLASHYFGAVATVGYANNTAVNVDLATKLVTYPTLATSHQANPYLTTVTFATPAYLPAAADQTLIADWVVRMEEGVIYRLFGVIVSFTRLDH